jgi:hypothetical protein
MPANKDNILQTVNPKLAREWHPTKNALLTPNDVTAGSHKKVWWLCRKGHEWSAAITNRSKGTGCPYCAGNIVNRDNCLQTINPELAKEWHPTKNAPLTPKDVTIGSDKIAWWICSKGHEWNASIYSRTRGRGCPYCSSTKVHRDNCLQTKKPELAKEWHPTKNAPLTPNDVTAYTEKKVWWICRKGHEWDAAINSRSSGSGCPYCSGSKVHRDNCLRTKKPQLAKEWHPTKNSPLTPNDVTASTKKKVWWLCRKGHEWNASINSRSKGTGCPICSGLKPTVEDCLETISPWISKQWHPKKNGSWTPRDVAPHSGRTIWWECENGHEYRERVIDRYRRGGCPVCILKRKYPQSS